MKNVLFICSGNTCRSPMAEGICNVLAARKGLAVSASSCGVAALEGRPATEEAIEAAAEYGADLSGHSARTVTPELCAGADVIVCMTEGHARAVQAAFGLPGEKFRVAGVPDPYGLGGSAYRACARAIADYCGALLEEL